MSKKFARVTALVLALIMSAFCFCSASAESSYTVIETSILNEMDYTLTEWVSTEDNRLLFALSATFDLVLSDSCPEDFANSAAEATTSGNIFVGKGSDMITVHWITANSVITVAYMPQYDMGAFYITDVEGVGSMATIFMDLMLTVDNAVLTEYWAVDCAAYEEAILALDSEI